MSEIFISLKNVLTDGFKAAGRVVKGAANSTRYKLDELDSKSRRREALSELGEKVYSMYQAGVEMPEEAMPLLNELRALDEGMETMRTERVEKKKADAEQLAEERVALKAQRAEAKQARAESRAAAKQAREEKRAAAVAAAAAAAAAEAEAEAEQEAEEVPTIEVISEVPVEEDTPVPVLEVEAEAANEIEAPEDEEPMMM